jgi:hypothetical protein
VQRFHNQYNQGFQGNSPPSYPARTIALWLDGDGIANSEGFFSARCPAHNDQNASLSLKDLRGRLWVRCWAGCSRTAINKALRALLKDGTFADTRRITTPEPPAPKVDLLPIVIRILGETEVRDGSLVDDYIRGRGLVTDSPVLRFHRHLFHKNSGTSGPAMVAPVQNVDGKIVALHRTWIDPLTTRKANIKPPRMALGPIAGGAIRINEAVPGHALLVAEGIETAIAAGMIHHLPVWSAVSGAGLGSLVLPPAIDHVVIAVDNDLNLVGSKQANKLHVRLLAQNPRAKVRQALPNSNFKDFNDQLIGKVRA